MAYAVGHISGGHFNPAITIGLADGQTVRMEGGVPYVVTQVVAAIAASATLWLIAINQTGNDEGQLWSPAGSPPTATATIRPASTTWPPASSSRSS